MVRILILDDRSDYVRALKSALQREFDVVTAQTIEEAKLALTAATKVALVDVRLSDEDFDDRQGVAFLQWAKEHYPGLPILMMSAFQDFEALVEALNCGADYFLKKPIDLRELKAILHEFAEHGQHPEKTAELRQRQRQEPR
jgi:DNA-binding NtrC family response regulator